MRVNCSNVQDAILQFCTSVAPDPQLSPFRPDVAARGLLYPADYRLSAEQFAALRDTSVARGQTGFVMQSILRDYKTGELEQDCVAVVWSDPNAESARIESPIESVMVDNGGEWIIVFDIEDFAVIGGSKDFVDEYFRRLGTTSTDNIKRYVQDFEPPPELKTTLLQYAD